MLLIDGSFGEGGGQILRTSLAMSLLTKTPITINRIRANRKPKSGLQPQHLMCVQAAAQIGNAKVEGAKQGSSAITFIPGEVTGGNYHFPIRTAGATALVLHTVYLPLALNVSSPSRVIINGGTHVSHAPSYDFLAVTWAKHMQRIGINLDVHIREYGFYPRGGGEIETVINPVKSIHAINDRELVTHQSASVVGAIAGLDGDIAKRLSRRATVLLQDRGLPVESQTAGWSNGPSCAVLLSVTGGPVPVLVCGLGERGRPADAVATDAYAELKPYLDSGAAIDPHSADQLLLPLAFADQESVFTVSEVTQHLLTNARTIELFGQASFTIEGQEGSPGVVFVRPNGL